MRPQQSTLRFFVPEHAAEASSLYDHQVAEALRQHLDFDVSS